MNPSAFPELSTLPSLWQQMKLFEVASRAENKIHGCKCRGDHNPCLPSKMVFGRWKPSLIFLIVSLLKDHPTTPTHFLLGAIDQPSWCVLNVVFTQCVAAFALSRMQCSSQLLHIMSYSLFSLFLSGVNLGCRYLKILNGFVDSADPS